MPSSTSTEEKSRKDFHHLTLKKIFIHHIRDGLKTVEGRPYDGRVLKYKVNDRIRFYYYSNSSDDVTCRITDIKCFKTFREMLVDSGFKNCVPDIDSLDKAIEAYEQIPKYVERQNQSGVVAIHLSPLSLIDDSED